jgi:hypothetical protein
MASNQKLYELLIYSNASWPMFDPSVKTCMEQHLQYLKTAGNVREVLIDNKYKGKYYGDFYAVLSDLGLAPKYHYLTLLLNGMTNPIEFVNQLTTVRLPDTDIIDQILSVYNTGKANLKTEPGQ